MSFEQVDHVLADSIHDSEQSGWNGTQSGRRWSADNNTCMRAGLQDDASISWDHVSSENNTLEGAAGLRQESAMSWEASLPMKEDFTPPLNHDPSASFLRLGGDSPKASNEIADSWLFDEDQILGNVTDSMLSKTTSGADLVLGSLPASGHDFGQQTSYDDVFNSGTSTFEPWTVISASPTPWRKTNSSVFYSAFPEDAMSTTSEVRSIEMDQDSEIVRCSVPGCQSQFRGEYRRGNLQRHERLNHGPVEPRTYQCHFSGCVKTFKRQDARLKHYRKRHPHLVSGAISRGTLGRGRESKQDLTLFVPREQDRSTSHYLDSLGSVIRNEMPGQAKASAGQGTILSGASSPFLYSEDFANLFDLDSANESPVTNDQSDFENGVSVGPSDRSTCTDCGKSFQRQNDLRRHMLIHQGSQSMHYCKFPDCDRRTRGFPRKDKMMDHMRKYHKATVSTSGDGSLQVAVPEAVEETMEQPSWQCSVCGLIFKRESQLDQHNARKHERRHKCNDCNSAFNLKADLDRHKRTVHKATDESVLRCPVEGCAVEFVRKDNLVRHLRRVHGQDDVGVAIEDLKQLPRSGASEKGTSTRAPSPEMDVGKF